MKLAINIKVCPAEDAFAAEAVQALTAGNVIAVPTDTLYGFACDAWYVCYLLSLYAFQHSAHNLFL